MADHVSQEIVTIAGAPAVVGLEDEVAHGGQDRLVVARASEAELVRSRRPAVGLDHERIPRAGLGYFLVTGALIAAAVLCMYGGLVTGQVVVVSPIIAAYPLFTLLTALMFKQERLTAKLALGVFLVVGGVVLISRGSATG